MRAIDVLRMRRIQVGSSELNVGSGEAWDTMKSFLLLVGGMCAAAAGFLVWGPKRRQPVEDLAHKLEQAWADHHTVV